MTTEIIAYIGAALMVVLAYLAYRYWRATAAYARRARESHAQRALESYQIGPLAAPQVAAEEAAPDAEPELSPETVEVAGEDETGFAVADQQPVDQEPAESDSVEQDSVEEKPADEKRAEPDSVEEEPVDQEPAEPDSVEEKPIDQESVEKADHGAALRAEGDAESVESEMGEEVVEGDGLAIEEVEAAPDAPDDGSEAAIEERSEKVSTDLEELDPELRLIEELEPRPTSTVAASGREIGERLKQLDEEIAALPSGVELIDLPILERRRVADRRQELLNDRAHLLAQRKRGAHRRGGRRNRRPRKD